MLKKRVIPCLLLDGKRLVKTTRFKKPQYVGDPINAVKVFNDKEVDEIVLLDITASKSQQPPNFRLIEEIAGECFIPLAYGGGIRTVEHAKKLFDLGIEKVVIQTANLQTPQLITDLAKRFGSQSVVASIDINKTIFGKKKPYYSAVGKYDNCSIDEAIDKLVQAGAGEIIINSIYNDGVMNGLDTTLIADISTKTKVPVVFMGGVGSLSDIENAIKCGADAVGVGSFFVFHGPHKGVVISYPTYDTLQKLIG